MNDFPKTTIDDLIKRVRFKNIEKEKLDPKLYKSITYIPGLSERLKNSKIIDKEKYNIAFSIDNSTKHLFSNTKSKLEKEETSNVVYEIKCKGDETNVCSKVYVGTTGSKLKTRLSAHKSDQKARNKPIEQKTALAAHCTITGHSPDFENVNILDKHKIPTRRYFLEMCHIINLSMDKRINYKTDTHNLAQTYRQIITKVRNQNRNVS